MLLIFVFLVRIMSENTEDTSKKMVFEHFSSIPEMFLNTVKTKPQNIALEFFRKGKIMKYTFEDYRDRVFWLAAGLITLDLKPKEHISILAHTSHRWCISDMSILCT